MSQNTRKHAGQYPVKVHVAMTEAMYRELLYHAWDPRQIPALIRSYLQNRLEVERAGAKRPSTRCTQRRIIP